MIRLVNIAIAHLLKEATIATTGGSEIEVNKYEGPVSTIVSVLAGRDGDISSNFDEIIEDNFENTTLEELLIDNHSIQATKVKIFGQLVLEHTFGFFNYI